MYEVVNTLRKCVSPRCTKLNALRELKEGNGYRQRFSNHGVQTPLCIRHRPSLAPSIRNVSIAKVAIKTSSGDQPNFSAGQRLASLSFCPAIHTPCSHRPWLRLGSDLDPAPPLQPPQCLRKKSQHRGGIQNHGTFGADFKSGVAAYFWYGARDFDFGENFVWGSKEDYRLARARKLWSAR